MPVGKAKAGKVPAVPDKVKKRSLSVSHGSWGRKVLLEVVFPLIVGITDENRKGETKKSPRSVTRHSARKLSIHSSDQTEKSAEPECS